MVPPARPPRVLTDALPDVLGGGEPILHFQPEVDLSSGTVVGMEALVRWRHPQRGLLWPRDFLPAIDAAGLAPALSDWVLRSSIDVLQTWVDLPPTLDGGPRQLWVNVSGRQLLAHGFVTHMHRLVAEAGVPAGVLGIEVTEAALARQPEHAARLLEQLRQVGVATAVDDFGTWYSTLATLDDLPIDAVKLDREFVRGVGSDLDDDMIVAAIIRLAHARDKYVVAEGVESWAEGARLCELGCDRAIGYLFSGPQRAEHTRQLLLRGTGWRAPAAVGGSPPAGAVLADASAAGGLALPPG